jgi:hypothetical protein
MRRFLDFNQEDFFFKWLSREFKSRSPISQCYIQGYVTAIEILRTKVDINLD